MPCVPQEADDGGVREAAVHDARPARGGGGPGPEPQGADLGRGRQARQAQAHRRGAVVQGAWRVVAPRGPFADPLRRLRVPLPARERIQGDQLGGGGQEGGEHGVDEHREELPAASVVLRIEWRGQLGRHRIPSSPVPGRSPVPTRACTPVPPPLSRVWFMQGPSAGKCAHGQPRVRNRQRRRRPYLRAMGGIMTTGKQSADAPRPDGESGGRTEDRKAAPRREPRQPRPYPDRIDDTLDDSFPASDPPSWAGR